MPVTMDPAKKRRRSQPAEAAHPVESARSRQVIEFGEDTQEDKIKALADAEKKNLWDATEVINMDTF